MRAHVLQHVAFEGLGSILPWLDTHCTAVTFTRFYDPELAQLPDASDFDVLIALGGPMSVNDEQHLPWLVEEKAFIRAAIESGKGVLGICLGAQLMASCLGARVYPGQHKEIGWHPVDSCHPPAAAFAFPARAEVFHWHGETFDLPQGAVHLARSEGCAHQAFQIGERAIGLQFHLETTHDSAQAIIAHCQDELVPGRYVQSEAALKAASLQQYEGINRLMARVLAYITR